MRRDDSREREAEAHLDRAEIQLTPEDLLWERPERNPALTPAEVREAELLGVKVAAGKHGVRPVAIRRAIKRQKVRNLAAVAEAEANSAYVRGHVDLMAQINLHVDRMNRLGEACEEFLADPDRPGKYYLGPRSEEIKVVYKVQIQTGTKKNGEPVLKTVQRTEWLSNLLTLAVRDLKGDLIDEVVRSEYKYADPRKLMIDGAAEARANGAEYRAVMQQVVDLEFLKTLHDAVMDEIRHESPECAARIARRLTKANGFLARAFSGG